MTDEQSKPGEDEGRPVFRDKRRFDPETGEPRQPDGEAGAADAAPAQPEAEAAEQAQADQQGDDLSPEDRALLDSEAERVRSDLEAKAAEHLDELQRLRAEYVNFRKRVERERAADHSASVAGVVTALLPALDDLALAQQHGDLGEGSPLALVAQKLQTAFASLDLHEVGEVGEPFDTGLHEAIAQLPNPEVTGPTIADVVQRGYRIGERLLRPAKVAVFMPVEDDGAAEAAGAE